MDRHQPSSDPLRSSLRAARAHLIPGFVLQAMALGLVLAYYHWAPARAALDRLMALKLEFGFGFSMVSTAVFGGLLPWLYLGYEGRRKTGQPRHDLAQGISLLLFWAYKGFEVDLFYRVLAHVFGTGHDAGTILKKAITDQLFYSPWFAVPVTVTAYQLADARGGFRIVLADIRAPGWFSRRIVPVLVSNAGVWIPAVAIIYALPTPLQLPLQNLVLCFYTLIVIHQM